MNQMMKNNNTYNKIVTIGLSINAKKKAMVPRLPYRSPQAGARP